MSEKLTSDWVRTLFGVQRYWVQFDLKMNTEQFKSFLLQRKFPCTDELQKGKKLE